MFGLSDSFWNKSKAPAFLHCSGGQVTDQNQANSKRCRARLRVRSNRTPPSSCHPTISQLCAQLSHRREQRLPWGHRRKGMCREEARAEDPEVFSFFLIFVAAVAVSVWLLQSTSPVRRGSPRGGWVSPDR